MHSEYYNNQYTENVDVTSCNVWIKLMIILGKLQRTAKKTRPTWSLIMLGYSSLSVLSDLNGTCV